MTINTISLVSELDKNIVLPSPFDVISVLLIELSPAIQHIVSELALNVLVWGQVNPSLAMLIVLTEFTLVFYPVVLQKVPIVVRELFMQLFWILIVKFTVSVELFVEPFSVIGWMIFWVEKNALSVNLIVMEIALVVGSIAVDQLSVAFL